MRVSSIRKERHIFYHRPSCPEAAALPILGAADEVGSRGGPLDVRSHREEQLVGPHRERPEPTLVQVAGADGAVVGEPPLGVGHGEPAREHRSVAILARPEHELEIVRLRAVNQQPHVIRHRGLRQDALDGRIVHVGVERERSGFGAVEEVIDQVTLCRSSSWHARRDTTDSASAREYRFPSRLPTGPIRSRPVGITIRARASPKTLEVMDRAD